MEPGDVPPEIRFLQEPLSGGAAVLIALVALTATMCWASRRDRKERLAVLLAAAGGAALLVAINVVARATGWWVGRVFEPWPFTVLMVLTALGGIPGWVLWLAGYRWLIRHVRRPLLAYTAVVLVFIPIVIVADQWQMGRNQFQMAAGYQIWHDVLLGQVVMWSPVLFYEAARRWV